MMLMTEAREKVVERKMTDHVQIPLLDYQDHEHLLGLPECAAGDEQSWRARCHDRCRLGQ
jgi:hypothetical protein